MLNYIFWEITHRCNQRCRICPLYGVNNESELCDELATEENMTILKTIIVAQVLRQKSKIFIMN